MSSKTSCAAAPARDVTADEVHALARASLERTGYSFARTVSCEYDQGVLVLRGRVPSFYLKQLAHAQVRGLAGVDQVVNQIDVVGGEACSVNPSHMALRAKLIAAVGIGSPSGRFIWLSCRR